MSATATTTLSYSNRIDSTALFLIVSLTADVPFVNRMDPNKVNNAKDNIVINATSLPPKTPTENAAREK